jgi:hypothetical protein
MQIAYKISKIFAAKIVFYHIRMFLIEKGFIYRYGFSWKYGFLINILNFYNKFALYTTKQNWKCKFNKKSIAI